MEEKQVLNDLKVIRQIMDRTRQSVSGESGWFSVTGGMMWLVGFLSQQFLSEQLAGWVWLIVNTVGILVIVWLWARSARRGHLSSPIMRSVILSWLALGVFAGLFAWLFEVRSNPHVLLLVVVTIALGVVQIGLLFSYWPFSIAGITIAAATTSAFLLIPDYFSLVAGLLGGGPLISVGLWMVRSGTRIKGAR